MSGIFPVDYKFPYMGMTLDTETRLGEINLGADGVITDNVRSGVILGEIPLNSYCPKELHKIFSQIKEGVTLTVSAPIF